MKMDLERLKVFYVVAKEGGLLKASLKLNLTQPSLSRTIRLLEEELNTQLFERTGKGLALTAQGERTLIFAEKFLKEAELFERLLNDQSDSPQGDLRIITTPGMASFWLAQYIPGFIKLYPKIHLDIIGSTENIEPNIEKADVLIRTHMNHYPYLIQRHLQSFHHKIWASPEYLQKFGEPIKLEDLDHHRLLAFETIKFNSLANNTWILEIGTDTGKSRKPFLLLNSIEGLINYALLGVGLIGMPEELVKIKTNTLISVLEDIKGPIVDIYCIYPEQRQHSKNIILFSDYLTRVTKEPFSKWPLSE